MGLLVEVPVILRLLKLSVICTLFTVHGSTGYDIFPLPADLSDILFVESTPAPVSWSSNSPGSAPQHHGSGLLAPLASPPLMSTPSSRTKGLVPSLSPSTPMEPTPHDAAPPPLTDQGDSPSLSPRVPFVSPSNPTATPPSNIHADAPSLLPGAPGEKTPAGNASISVPVATPTSFPQIAPAINLSTPGTFPPTAHQRNASKREAPVEEPIAPGTFSPSPGSQERNESNNKAPGAPGPTVDPSIPTTLPPTSHQRNESNYEAPKVAPVAPAPPTRGDSPPIHHRRNAYDDKAPAISPTTPVADPDVSPASTPGVDWEKGGVPVAAPPNDIPKLLPPVNHLPTKGPAEPPAFIPSSGRRQNSPAHSPFDPGSLLSPSRHPFPPSMSHASPAPSPFPSSESGWTKMPILSPKVSPSGPSPRSPKIPFLPPIQALPPPPPNEDCSSTVCTEPYTNTPSGSPCGCVWPMQVGLRLSVALYTFFPLVSQLAEEMATGVFMKQSQVHIIGANAASQQPEKTIVLVDLVPLDDTFDNTTAFLTYQRFWHKRVVINPSLFGEYDVLYVRYPGLPPSPPSAQSITMIDGGPFSANGNNARAIKPLGVDVRNRQHKDGLSGGIIAVIVLSVLVAVVLCGAIACVLLFKHRDHASQPGSTQQSLPATVLKPSGTTGSIIGSGISSTSLSFASSIAPYTGSAKTFSTTDIEKATDNFNPLRVLGEGGFGRVYSGVLEDGTKVAVKVLKRDDQQGGREFLAEVEMLSRLHHRNLVKLIGICTEERSRCLVYELIPNGSVESHLHGIDKEAPLDWDARVKIALGAARGLAYLHEDSSPRVIHRDFKSSNILLEHDFTPKVSDFGLARAAMDEENKHVSTRVMGTFGYVAPEYAMTGHLLVKSDVYSYGVVLLELLTGRKPVDMSQLPGQENLVAWARPLLTSREGLETIVDPCLGPDVSFDSISKVAAIASMCVQSEVSHRPFMGEVVQALKLVCNECDEAKEVGSRTSSRENLSMDLDTGVSTGSRQLPDPLQSQYHMPHYDFGPDTEMGLSASDLFSAPARLDRQASGSFRRYSSSGPLRTGRGRQFWQTIRGLTGGSVSEHGVMFKVQPSSH
ncbi:receptor-like serine/threonine-protein kinase ALE2 isoform X2 [Tripterygium wilfordii]|uniref:receptor-like serine/threonine-protein kinase ALE2 isoform X2 n=1 Tax=Tripterygium wilfordii TaxID=458696 RepID=UPI0018F81D5A|nr:receptor-like serine/threonine-protein kinase ALE2 isoform X2 [Tripterygium wilfordii]